MALFGRKREMPRAENALPGRAEQMSVPPAHFVNGHPLEPPFPEGLEQAVVAMGCFWGAERVFWQADGVYTTAVGYTGGFTPNPTYHEVCTGHTGHTEAVLVVFDPEVISYEGILKLFWENHDPTQGMRQGNDTGTQYRSGIYTFTDDPARRGQVVTRHVPGGRSARPATARSPPRSDRSRPSITPRTTTSSTWRRTRAATAASAVRA